jgi:hypothetical protein
VTEIKPEQSAPPCNDCEAAKLKGSFDATAATVAFQRDLEQKRREYAHENAKVEREQQHKNSQVALAHANALDTARQTEAATIRTDAWAAERELAKLFHSTVAEVAKGSIDRARDSAKYVQIAASAIAAMYTSALALVFSVTDNPLPSRGVWAPVFLGSSIGLATAYLAYYKQPEKISGIRSGASINELQMNRTSYIVRWTRATVANKRWALRSSVVSLFFGVAFIAAPFISATRIEDPPPLPTPPSIPSEVAEAFTAKAQELFQLQVDTYRQQLSEHDRAVESIGRASIAVKDREDDLNRAFLNIAIVALVLALVIPWLFDLEDEQSGTAP